MHVKRNLFKISTSLPTRISGRGSWQGSLKGSSAPAIYGGSAWGPTAGVCAGGLSGFEHVSARCRLFSLDGLYRYFAYQPYLSACALENLDRLCGARDAERR